MLDFLRDPAWQGIAGIVAIITFVLYVNAERKKSSTKSSSRKIVPFQLVLLFVGSIGVLILTIGASTTVAVAVKGLERPWGTLLAGTLLGGGLAGFFSFISFVSLRNYFKDFDFLVFSLSFLLVVSGIILGIAMGLFISSIDTAIAMLISWAAGVFTMGISFTAVLLNDNESEKGAKEKHNNAGEH